MVASIVKVRLLLDSRPDSWICAAGWKEQFNFYIEETHMTIIHAQQEEDQDNGESCRHHWVIEAPEGPVSQGSCRACGEIRQFNNFIDSGSWGEDSREPAHQDAINVSHS